MPSKNYFADKEFACKCGCGYCKPDKSLIALLNKVREVLGAPIIVTSGCRCAKHNAKVGGVANSNHIAGAAADIVSAKTSPGATWELVRELWQDGKLPELAGLGRYDTFTHVDISPKVEGRLREWKE